METRRSDREAFVKKYGIALLGEIYNAFRRGRDYPGSQFLDLSLAFLLYYYTGPLLFDILTLLAETQLKQGKNANCFSTSEFR